MKAFITEAPSDESKPAIQLMAENGEEQNILWCLSEMGPDQYKLVENEDHGDAKVGSIVLEDESAGA